MANGFSRRHWMQGLAVGSCYWASSSWLPTVALGAKAADAKTKSVILLWLNGGPATIDLWDLKPGHENGGPFQEIQTSVAGTRISEHLPRLATQADDFSIVRSMSTREGDHSRARFVSMTGYTPQGAIKFPSLGSLVSHELDSDLELPAYVHIGGRPAISNGGFLGPKFSPFVVSGAGRTRPGTADNGDLRVGNLSPDGDRDRQLRMQFLNDLQRQSTLPDSTVVNALEAANERAIRLMQSRDIAAFNLEEEPDSLREAYGKNSFGQGCLMARRLVERGVSFVEVALDGWDTHADNFERVKDLSQRLDHGFASLIQDLKQRGLFESTLIVCQGEFGRTPKINGQAGRDHWPATWSAVLAGAGIQGGRVVGETIEDGTAVASDPKRTADLMATIFKGIGLDPLKQNMSNVSRPIRLADPSGKPIEELL